MEVGTFKARAIGATFGFTNSGKEQVAVLFEILDGPNANKRITWYGYFTEKTATRTLESLSHTGWDGNDLNELKGLGTTECALVLDEDTYEGNTRVRVNWVNKLMDGPTMKNSMDGNQRAAFAAKMKGKILAMKKAAGVAPDQEAEDDDFPFE